MRMRLNSTVFNVKPAKRGDYSPVDYVLNQVADSRGKYPHGKEGRRVGGKHVIMACWNRVTAHVVEGLPREQVQGLCYARKVPLIYGRVGLQQLAGVRGLQGREREPARDDRCSGTRSASRAGRGLRPERDAGQVLRADAEPAARAPRRQLAFTVVPNHPDAIPQLFAYSTGQQMLRELSWEELEDSVDRPDRPDGEQGGRRLRSGARHRRLADQPLELRLRARADLDVRPVAYGPVEDQPQYAGRQPFRNIAIANSDSEAFAYTHCAINEAHRAVQDLPSS